MKVFNISGWMLKSNFRERSRSPSSPRRTSRKPTQKSSLQVYEAPKSGRVSPFPKALELLPLELNNEPKSRGQVARNLKIVDELAILERADDELLFSGID